MNTNFRSLTDKDSANSSQRPSTEGFGGEGKGSHKTLFANHSNYTNISSATFLDVAVLRCLFISHWQEEGVYWALHFMYNR